MFGTVTQLNNRDTALALTVCLIVVVLFAALIKPEFAANGDFYFHYDRIMGNFEEGNTRFETYAGLSHGIASLFVHNLHSFYYIILVMNGIIVPILLYFIARKWIVVPLYFMASSYFYFMFGYFAQSLAGILLLSLFVVKDNRLRLLLVIISIPAHSQAFLLMAIAFILILLSERAKEGMFFPGCTGLVGSGRPDEMIDAKIAEVESRGMSLANVITFLTRIIGFPFLIMGLVQHRREGRYEFILLSAFAFIAAFFISPRILYIIPLLILPGVARFYYTLSIGKQWLFIGLALIWGIWEFYFWFSDRVLCGDG